MIQSIPLSEFQDLASQEGVSIELVETLYKAELERLRASARIPDFVPILATNRLKRQLRARRTPRRQLEPVVELHGA